MGRILSVDYGQKRTGLAVTDPMNIIANGLETVASADIYLFLDKYFEKEQVDTIVVGYPKTLMNEGAESLVFINPFVQELVKKYSEKEIVLFDERFTSKLAMRAMIEGGVKKSKRREKELTDKISAVIILQSYLESIFYKKLIK